MSNIAGSGCELLIPISERKPLMEIERSLIKTYRKEIWSKFTKAIKNFKLVNEGDRIAVGVSGGKDSLLLAKLFQELQKHGECNFNLEFISMNPGWHDSNLELLKSNCDYLNIPIHIYDSGIFDVVGRIAQDYPCYMCAKMRRGSLYAKVQSLGCNKLALAHHFDDVIETTMLNVLLTGSFHTMRPKLRSDNYNGLELIRPLYYVKENSIKKYTMNAGVSPMNCGCVVAAKKTSSKRREIKELILNLKSITPDVDKNIFNASQNVNLDMLTRWKLNGKEYSFLDDYDQELIGFDNISD